jgi:hypothetical protein
VVPGAGRSGGSPAGVLVVDAPMVPAPWQARPHADTRTDPAGQDHAKVGARGADSRVPDTRARRPVGTENPAGAWVRVAGSGAAAAGLLVAAAADLGVAAAGPVASVAYVVAVATVRRLPEPASRTRPMVAGAADRAAPLGRAGAAGPAVRSAGPPDSWTCSRRLRHATSAAASRGRDRG